MTPAPACSAPPSFPDGVLPQSPANVGSSRENSAQANSNQPASFATVLHQAKDDASADADASDKDARDQDKSAKQPAKAAPTAVPVPVAQPTKAPIVGFLNWAEKSADATEKDATASSSDQKKPETAAAPSATSFLMQAIAGLGIPQFTQHHEAGKAENRGDVRASVASAAPAATEDSSASLSVSPGTSVSMRDGHAQTLGSMAPPSDGEGQAAVSSGQLAFAARLNANTVSSQQSQLSQSQSQLQASHLQAAPSNEQNSPTAESEAVQPASLVTQAVQTQPEQAGEQIQKSESQALSSATASTEPIVPRAADAAHALDQPTDVRSADVDPAPTPGGNAAAVRDVRLQVAGSDNQRVDVRVMDRGGELRVSVRADDPALVRSLQDNVADLSNRLDQAHFRSEVWTPRTRAIEQTDSASTNGRTFSNGDETFGRDGRGQQQSGRQQQQPSWVDDFEENPARPNSGGTLPWQP